MFTSQNIPLHAFNPSRPGGNKRLYILKETRSWKEAVHLYDHTSMCGHWIPPETHLYMCFSGVRNLMFPEKLSIFTRTKIVWFNENMREMDQKNYIFPNNDILVSFLFLWINYLATFFNFNSLKFSLYALRIIKWFSQPWLVAACK